MARQRDPNRDKAFEIYKEHNGDIPLKDIAAQLNKGEGTIRGWKNKDSWDVKLNGTLQTDERNAPLENTERSNRREDRQTASSSQEEERKRGGNPSPTHKFPKHNKAAEKHGFYSKVIPEELRGLFDEIGESISTTDMLWDQIKVQYMAIMRAQSIMFVESKEEMIKEIKKEKYGYSEVETTNEHGETELKYERTLDEVEYEFQFSWERQAQFLTAQSRAIAELRNLIEQFEKIVDETDLRHLRLQQMQTALDKSKLDIEIKNKELEILGDNNKDKTVNINFVRKG